MAGQSSVTCRTSARHRPQPFGKGGLRCRVADERDMHVNEALARPVALHSPAGRRKADRLTAVIADHFQDRMNHQPHRMAGSLQLGQHGIEDEGPVACRNLDNGMRPPFRSAPGTSATLIAVGSPRQRKKAKASRLISARTADRIR
jgi:hypothetical protein